jgi:hypothetical protein
MHEITLFFFKSLVSCGELPYFEKKAPFHVGNYPILKKKPRFMYEITLFF